MEKRREKDRERRKCPLNGTAIYIRCIHIYQLKSKNTSRYIITGTLSPRLQGLPQHEGERAWDARPLPAALSFTLRAPVLLQRAHFSIKQRLIC